MFEHERDKVLCEIRDLLREIRDELRAPKSKNIVSFAAKVDPPIKQNKES